MTATSLLSTPRADDRPHIAGTIRLGAGQNSWPNQRTWVHVLSHLHPKYGGLSAVVPQLTSAIVDASQYGIGLTAFCEQSEGYSPAVSQGVQVAHLPLSQGKGSGELAAAVASCSGVHIHGIWQRSTTLAASLARKSYKPYIISAHGMLEPWALANKRWKKKIYLALVEKANLRGAACLHALTRAEANDYRRLGLRNPIAIIPNGVLAPLQCSPEAFLERFPALSGKRMILFLGRIHFKKGLDILCQAWSRIAANWPDAQLVLAGPDFEGTQVKVERMLTELQLESRVTWIGMLTGDDKWNALSAAEFFVLPSYSEGLSVSTLEAMSVGKPVLITENCHLPEVAQQGCGMVITATANQLTKALNDMLSYSPAASAEMGRRGEHMIQTRYSWQAIGQQMADLYRWLEGGPKPADVEIDLWDEQHSGGERS